MHKNYPPMKDMVSTEFWSSGRIENEDGIHVTNGEFTLCGDSFDIPNTEYDVSEFHKATSRIVSCERCAQIVLLCRGIRVAKHLEK